MKSKCQKFVGFMTAAGLMVSAYAAHAQEMGAPAEEPEVQAQGMMDAEPAPAPQDMQPAAPAPAPQDPAMEMQQLQMQLQQVSMQLQQIQQQALQVQEVMDAFEAYEAELRAKMLALSPEAESDIEMAEELVEELREVGDPSALSPEEAQEFQAKYMEFQQASQRLQPIEQQASTDPELQEAREELEAKVMDAMRDVNPEAEAILETHEELVERYMELEQQRQQQQPRMQQQQPRMQQQQPQMQQQQPQMQQQQPRMQEEQPAPAQDEEPAFEAPQY